MNQKRPIERKPVWMTTLLAAAAVCLCAWLLPGQGWSSERSLDPGPPVAVVNGVDIPEAELGSAMSAWRASVIDEFRRERGMQWSAASWQTAGEGPTPLEVLRDRALEEVIRLQVLLQAAVEAELAQDSSYATRTSLMRQENARRSADKEAGLTVYGPVALDEHRFTELYASTLRLELMESLANGPLAVSEKELREHYETIKDEWFRMEDEVSFVLLTASYRDDNEQLSADDQSQLYSELTSVQGLLEQGCEPEEAAGRTSLSERAISYTITEHRLHEGMARTLYKSQPELYRFVSETGRPGEVSHVEENPQTGQYAVALIQAREPGGYESFELQRGNVRKHYLSSAFDTYLEERIRSAEIELTSAAHDEQRWLRYVKE